MKISTSFTQTSVVRITGNADEAWVHEPPPRRGSFLCLHPELSEKPGESCMPSGSQRGAGGGERGWQLADSGAQEMQGDLQEQWVSFWGADIRRGADMWWRGWNQRGKVGPPCDCPTATVLV